MKMMNRLFGFSMMCGLFVGCGIDLAPAGDQAECGIDMDCLDRGEYVCERGTCQPYRCSEHVKCSGNWFCNAQSRCVPYLQTQVPDAGLPANSAADMMTAPSTPPPWVARSGGSDVLQLAAKYLSEADTAMLVGEPLPLKWDTGPQAVRQVAPNGEKYYAFDLGDRGVKAGTSRLSYYDPGRKTWAEYGGEKNFAELPADAASWLCQYVDDGGACTTSVFISFDGTNVSPAGRAVCENRRHTPACRNLHNK